MQTKQITWQEIEAAWPSLRLVEGGYTAAERGIVTLPDGRTVFVKRAVDEQTAEWVRREKKAYTWLAAQQYPYAPRLIAEGPDGFALPDLSAFDWQDSWYEAKLEAALEAMTALAGLSETARGVFDDFDEPEAWATVPHEDVLFHQLGVEPGVLQQIQPYLPEGPARHRLEALSARHPDRGTELVHLDVRADNFCYDPISSKGYLIDWSWLCFGNAAYDRTALLVSVMQHGYNVRKACPERLDKASLANLTGFWLSGAAREATDSKAIVRRRHQAESAAVSLRLLEELFAHD